ncbi:hypothetical protein [Amycolatopsis sp. CA-128772]|uniref:hypothetical protein n=1 Tax=Amycolatopsis sp. CA-128772 TaxID=2073159 RepID=UPI000CD1E32A|nr:hypothetical protein [Amycolatopsis sp. CA-128772]
MRYAKRTALTTALAAVLALISRCSALGGSAPDPVAGSPLETYGLTALIIGSVDATPTSFYPTRASARRRACAGGSAAGTLKVARCSGWPTS